jgi:hypothetical protein
MIASIRGSERWVAGFKSESWPASDRNRWPASYWNAWPASSESAGVDDKVFGSKDAQTKPAPRSRATLQSELE